ncbi:hypothetical protein SAMN05444167_1089 [Terriglobus roseus]|uniref:Uncharacterized protein n=1 Tax=Terriglobus roseus TaxID=392734 RepID=A0A1G7HIB3_9BACT|nr:hypothetical protein SAMN05444167_1089 [Terriglobus roseus]
MSTRRMIPLPTLTLLGLERPIPVRDAVLVEYGRNGLTEWVIRTGQELPPELIRRTLTFRAGGYEGSCYYADRHELRGSGPVRGLHEER